MEEIYSETSLQFSREWEKKSKRDQIREDIQKAKNVPELARHLLTLDAGFCHPHALRYKEDVSEKPAGSQSDEEMSSSQGEEEVSEEVKDDEYKNVKRFKLKLFKFWPQKELRDAWR